MQRKPQILFHQLTYNLPQGKPVFHDLNLSITAHKTGLIGKNGIGKTTLLNLIAGKLKPISGSIEISDKVAYLSQNYSFPMAASVGDTLGIQQKLAAMQRIINGSSNPHDFAIFDEDWLLLERTQQTLEKFGIGHIHFHCNRNVQTLSGGEITRLKLMKMFSSNADILLLDELTNHLDLASIASVETALNCYQGALIVISHDQDFLQNFNAQKIFVTPFLT